MIQYRYASVFLLVVGVSETVAASLPPPQPVTLCNVVNEARTAHAQHAKFAAAYYASEYPQLAVRHKYIGLWEAPGVSTQRGVAQAFVLNSSDCTLVIGPGASTLSAALNPLINTPWIEFGATATELSSGTNYPYFTRVIPNTGITTGSIGLVLQELGWTTINMLVASSAYGLSAASTMASSLGDDGQIMRADTVSNDITAPAMNELLSVYLHSPTKLLFVGLTSTDAALATFVAAATRMNLTDHLVVFFSEGMCSGSNAWTKFRGSFCIGTQVNQTAAEPFLHAYSTSRNLASEIAEFTALGFPGTKVDVTSTGSYQSLAADAARFGLRALGQYVTRYGDLNGSTTTLVDAIGKYVMPDGLTGYVAIANATGDRLGAAFVIMNARPDAAAVPAFNISAQGNVTLAAGVYLLGAHYSMDSLPPLIPSSASTESALTVAIGVAASCAAVVFLVLALLVTLIPRWKTWRRLRTAPRDETEPFTIVFTDIERSTALWAELPEQMGSVLDEHNAIIRAALQAHEGYEVKTIGDSFMCAFTSAHAALAFAVAVQEALHQGNFPLEVDDFYRDMMRELGIARPVDYTALWHGVRVRIGLHTGTGAIVLDAVHNIYDYYGSVVNTAARIEHMGHGGQILASETTMRAAGYSSAAAADRVELHLGSGTGGVVATAVGAVALRGVPEPVALFDVRSAQFAMRSFPIIRAEADDVVNGDEEEGSQSSGDMDGEALIRDVQKQLDSLPTSKSAAHTPRSEQSSTYRRRRRSSTAKGLGMLTEPSAVDARDRVRRLLAVRLRRTCTNGSNEAKYRASVATHLFLGLNAMFRVIPTERRARMLNETSTAWRVPKTRASPAESDHEHELTLLLAVKVVHVLGAARVLVTDFKQSSMSTDQLLDSTDLTTATDDAGTSFLHLPREASNAALKEDFPLPA